MRDKFSLLDPALRELCRLLEVRKDPPEWLAAIRRHPIITTVLVVCAVAGAVVAPWLFPGHSVVRTATGGAIAGSGIGLIITLSRMIGAFEDE